MIISGITIDNPWRKNLTQAIQALPKRVLARVVFDEGQTPADYRDVMPGIFGVCDVMGEILDSAFMRNCSLVAYKARAQAFITAFPQVAVWEVGNEINGAWLGAGAIDKAAAAFDIAKAAGKKTALTLYHSLPPDYQDPNGPMLDWARKNVPARMLSGLDYVFVSYYSQDNGRVEPKYAEWHAIMQSLAGLFPNSKIGFGECGLAKPTSDYIRLYYDMRFADIPQFVGGWFYWYFCSQCVPKTAAMWQALSDCLRRQ